MRATQHFETMRNTTIKEWHTVTGGDLPDIRPKTKEELRKALKTVEAIHDSRRQRRAELYRIHQAYIDAVLELYPEYESEQSEQARIAYEDWLHNLREEASQEAEEEV